MNEFQDAYALCRVFKKSEPGPKIIEHYGAPCEEHRQWMTELSPNGIGDYLESSSCHFQPSDCSQTTMIQSSFDTNNSWMQFLTDEALSTNNDSIPSSRFSYVPSKVILTIMAYKQYIK